MRALGLLTRLRAPKPAPTPTFTPNVRVTAPIHIPAGRHTTPGRVRVARTDRAAMEQALRGIDRIDWVSLDSAKKTEGATHAGVRRPADPLTDPDWPTAELAASRADRFVADMRMRGGLPLFRQAACRAGWSGLNEESPRSAGAALGRPGWLADWEADSRNVIAAWVKTARIEVGGTYEALARQEARIRDAADAAFALGHPVSAL